MSDRLDLDGAARLLGTPRATLERWVRQGLLRPLASASGRVVFARTDLEAWARRRGLRLAERESAPAEPAPDMLADAIERGAYTRAAAENARAAIEVAVEALTQIEPGSRAALRERVLDRERLAGTGLGQGIAVPHPRTPPAELVRQPTVSLLLLDEPVDWAALDGKPVHAVFLLVSPTAAEHLELLARVARVLRDPEFPVELARRPERDELLDLLRNIRRHG